ncbi:MAG: DUF4339 domain-containing protein [Muribaculaceae bacterium]|nr:DUF4339 domain-containing protein [Muribaculaceae bacterium]
MKYYIAENGQPAGPFEPSELLAHGLTVNSLVWGEGMPNWTSASQVPELMALLSGQTFNPGNMDTQLPQMPPMGEAQLPQVPPFNPQPTTTGTPYGQGTPNQPYAPPQYGPSTNQPSRNVMPKTWLTESIIATVLCSLCCGAPFVTLIPGVIAIFQANGVKTKFNMGDYAGANKKSSSAKMWMLITVGVGILAAVAYTAYMMISNPELLQQIQDGSGISNLYPFLK